MESGWTCWTGAKYNSTGFSALGVGNVADSMMTIKKLVFDEKKVTARELLRRARETTGRVTKPCIRPSPRGDD